MPHQRVIISATNSLRGTTTLTVITSPASISTILFISLFLLLLATGGALGQSPSVFPGAPPIQYSSLSGPTFAESNTTTVKAVAGTTAMLPCAVKNLHNYTVSWVRGRDIRLLTTSTITYTSDSRFVAAKFNQGSHWLLKIHYVKPTDAGVYLCQVSTSPPITQSVDLDIQEPIARVLPGSEVYVQVGSRLEVVCKVEGCPSPALLTWTRAGDQVSSGATESFNGTENNIMTPVATLKFSRSDASPADSGNYSCSSKCTKSITVAVHVLRG